jgi:hypothetical protein
LGVALARDTFTHEAEVACGGRVGHAILRAIALQRRCVGRRVDVCDMGVDVAHFVFSVEEGHVALLGGPGAAHQRGERAESSENGGGRPTWTV